MSILWCHHKILAFLRQKITKFLKILLQKSQNSLYSQCRIVPKLDMYSLLLVETTNDMSFSLPETKYDEPFEVIGNISITNLMNQCLSKNLIDLISRSPH